MVKNRAGQLYIVEDTNDTGFKFLSNVDQTLSYKNITFYENGTHTVSRDGYVVNAHDGGFGNYPNPRDVYEVIKN